MKRNLRVAVIDDAGFGTGKSGLFGKELYSGLVADINGELLGNATFRLDLLSMNSQMSPGRTGGRGVPILRAFRDAGTTRSLGAFIRQTRADIAHVNIANSRYPRSIIKAVRNEGIALVSTVHSYSCLCPSGWATKLPELEPCENLGAQIHCPICLWKGTQHGPAQGIRMILDGINQYSALRLLLRESDSIIVPSKALATRIDAEMGRLELNVAYNPVPAGLLKSEPCLGEDKTIAFAGRLTYEKGVHLLPRLSDMMKGTKFHVMGSGPLANFMRIHARARENLIFHGFVSQAEKMDIFRRARAIIVPSLWFEAFGYSAAEALALGKPVVGFDIGGIGELISRSGGGKAVKPFNIGDFAEALESILENTQTAVEMGKRGKEFALTELSEDGFALELQRVYAKALSRRR